jgi:hypothetical protein
MIIIGEGLTVVSDRDSSRPTDYFFYSIEHLPFPQATMVTSGPLEQCDPDKGLCRFSRISKNEIRKFLIV